MTEQLQIRPGVGVLALFPAMNYKPWYALGEFVDNALASYQEDLDRLTELEGGDYRLRVEVELHTAREDSRIIIRDNAGGIPQHRYSSAFQTARLPDERLSNALRQFGVGMKSAACWFAKQWRVTTTALGETERRVVTFNVPEIVDKGVETLDPDIDSVPPEDHYTVVELWDLNRVPYGKTIGKIKSHLASIYRRFTRSDEMILLLDDTELTYQEPAVLEAPPHGSPDSDERIWRREIEFESDEGVVVSGFAAIRQRGSTRDAGFALFQDGRLIVGSDDDTYRPQEIFGSSNTFRYQRIFGELEIQGIGLAHSKDAFQWDGKEASFIDDLKAELDRDPFSLLDQADKYRALKAEHNAVEAAHRAVEKAADEFGSNLSAIVESHAEEGDAESAVVDQNERDVVSDFRRQFLLRVADQEWEVTLSLLNDPSVQEWVRLADSAWKNPALRPRQVNIAVNLAHDFLRRYVSARGSELDVLIRIAAALMLSETTVRQGGSSAGVIALRRRTNDLLAAMAEGES